MRTASSQRDLIAIVADKNLEFTLRGILSRPKALGCRAFAADILVHVERDPGCYLRAHDFLRAFSKRYYRALVLFDREGCGSERKPREDLEHEVESRLEEAGWKDRASAVVLDPELEAWVWSDSPHVPEVLGWSAASPAMTDWLREQGLLNGRQAKPEDPKAAMEAVLRKTGRPRSAARYEQLAKRVSFERCGDLAFAKLKQVLRAWFPSQPPETR